MLFYLFGFLGAFHYVLSSFNACFFKFFEFLKNFVPWATSFRSLFKTEATTPRKLWLCLLTGQKSTLCLHRDPWSEDFSLPSGTLYWQMLEWTPPCALRGRGAGTAKTVKSSAVIPRVLGMQTLVAFQKQVGASPGWWGFPLQIVSSSHFLTHRIGR